MEIVVDAWRRRPSGADREERAKAAISCLSLVHVRFGGCNLEPHLRVMHASYHRRRAGNASHSMRLLGAVTASPSTAQRCTRSGDCKAVLAVVETSTWESGIPSAWKDLLSVRKREFGCSCRPAVWLFSRRCGASRGPLASAIFTCPRLQVHKLRRGALRVQMVEETICHLLRKQRRPILLTKHQPVRSGSLSNSTHRICTVYPTSVSRVHLV